MEFGKKQITLFKAISLALIVTCVFLLLTPWLSVPVYSGLKASIGVFSTSIDGEYTSFWSVMLIINAILLVLTAALAIYGLMKDKNSLVLPFAVVGFISFFLAVFQKAFLDESNLHVGIGAWLTLFLSVLAFVAALLDNLAAGKPAFSLADFGIQPGAVRVNRGVGGWACPNCGARQGAAQNFCDRCGTKKPEPPRCPNCGKIARPGEGFCSDCGTRLQ